MTDIMKQKKQGTVVIGSQNSSDAAEYFRRENFCVYLLPTMKTLMPALSAHSDMIFCRIGDTVVFSSEYYNENTTLLNEVIQHSGLTLYLSESVPENKYPADVCFNVLVCGKYAFGNPKAVSKDVLLLLEQNHMQFVAVKQGYAACSACVIGDEKQAIITADSGIYKSASKLGIQTLLISPCKDIQLSGLDYGFIGGCSGYFESTLYTVGDLSRHPDYEKIYNFCQKQQVKIHSIGKKGNPLTDIGGIKFL